jgi:hypothetical protein
VQAVVVSLDVAKKKRCRTLLTCRVAAAQEYGVRLGESRTIPRDLVPSIRDWHERFIQRAAKLPERRRKRIRKVLVFVQPKPCRAITMRVRKRTSCAYMARTRLQSRGVSSPARTA